MKVAYWVPKKYVTSVLLYTRHVVQRLKTQGFEFIPFSAGDVLPADADLYWDSTCTGGKNPNKRFLKANRPLVVTVHGAAPMALPLSYTYNGKTSQFKGWWHNQKKIVGWQSLGHKVSRIITVSNYARREIVKHLPLRDIPVDVIYHGFDGGHFSPLPETDWMMRKEPYLFHISVYQPKKNIEGMLAAWRSLPPEDRMPFHIVAPGYPAPLEEGALRLDNTFIDQEQLAAYMRNARGFIFPSLHESFGLPILEAMASGCPVVTSNSTSCEEIGGDAALKVDPTDIPALAGAMKRIFSDEDLRLKLRRKGLTRASEFSWEQCADQHAATFRTAAAQKITAR